MILFDLDDTLANTQHRTHLIHEAKRGTKKDAPRWEKYNSLAHLDTPIKSIAQILNVMRWHTKCEIWSARCESTRAVTEKWLAGNVFINGLGSARWNDPKSIASVPLRLRPVDEHRSSLELKSEWAARHAGDPIELVFEDHIDVAKMWRERGVRVALIDTREYLA
jgi:hypothetical protein